MMIMTDDHGADLAERLISNGIDLPKAIDEDRYIALNAAEILARFMKNDEPDGHIFEDVVRETITKARGDGRRISAFGEMVALLWADGMATAAIQLERLWNGLIAEENLALLCAYPEAVHFGPAAELVRYIKAAHTCIV